MKNILKKNQLMITALAIMIAVAGYLQFTTSSLGEEEYVPASGDVQTITQPNVEDFSSDLFGDDYDLNSLLDLSEEDLEGLSLTEIESLDSDLDEITENYLPDDVILASGEAETPSEGEIPGEALFASSVSVGTLSEARMLKEQVRAKNKETLLEIINSTTLSDEQKQSAVDTMVAMTTIAEQEMEAEILLEAKGFPDVVVSIGDGSVDVVVNAADLTDAQRAQIEDIVKRKTNQPAENIIISTVVQ
ncbi:MAG: SpoIIIAH-like family protein [Lachnospiraceae bacterium]|nr:SpoIIIAH-like family protein [Lachnospiraceae bacterium]